MSFHALLRTGEAINVKAGDVTWDDHRQRAVVSLGLTKSGKRKGIVEEVIVDDPAVYTMLARQLRSKPAGTYLVPSAAAFRGKFAAACQALSLEALHLKPYSLRRGGATYMFRQSGNLHNVVVRGRWSSIATARIYINITKEELQRMQLSPAQSIQVARHERALLRALA